MYHLAAPTIRPPVRSSRRQHSVLQLKITELVDKVLKETEVVDTDNAVGKKLFNAMDAFFSHGLLSGDNAYWRCIRQFMPRAEVAMLIAESGDANDRYLSISWLKSAFNKGTLHFQMISFCNSANLIFFDNFYHNDACVKNRGLLEAVTNLIEPLQTVQFAFYSTRAMREEPMTAVIVETTVVERSSRSVAMHRKVEAEPSDTAPNRSPSEIPDLLNKLTTQMQSALLDELVRSRRIRLNSELLQAQKQFDDLYSQSSEEQTSSVPETQEKLEDVLVKTMSHVNMEALQGRSLDKVLTEEPVDLEQDYACQLTETEISLKQGDILQLAISIFEIQSERVIQAFVVVNKFFSVPLDIQYMVITNFNIYLLSRVQKTDSAETEPHLQSYFVRDAQIPHDALQGIKLAFDNLSIYFYANEDRHFSIFPDRENNELVNQEQSYSFHIGSLVAGESISHAIVEAVSHSSFEQKLDIKRDFHVEYLYMFLPSLTREVGQNMGEIMSMSLCFWAEKDISDEKLAGPDNLKGYLYRKNISPLTNWLKKSSDHLDQKYCMLSGTKLYVFVDSSCKEGVMIVDLTNGVELIVEEKKHDNIFVIKTQSTLWQFTAPSREEHARWIAGIAMIVDAKASSSDMIPSLLVVTENKVIVAQEGEKVWADGFVRTLVSIPKEEIVSGWVVSSTNEPDNRLAPGSEVIVLVQNPDLAHMLYFRTGSEVNRLANFFRSEWGYDMERATVINAETRIGKAFGALFRATADPWYQVRNTV
ncbi:unnamed protein product [Caenorhabditis auriculariae]|uniref:PH domain-containing protein n=1 Tax=Caenorhabditis auriculariae TaxID=2777116 RepID=A0A8S1H4H3_9PELO|nr:unnamed protein product [Caenorhabditis auriculariae]